MAAPFALAWRLTGDAPITASYPEKVSLSSAMTSPAHDVYYRFSNAGAIIHFKGLAGTTDGHSRDRCRCH